MKLKVTNISNRVYGANALRGTVNLEPGKSIEEEFDDNEATALHNDAQTLGDKAMFKVEGYSVPKNSPGPSGDAGAQARITDLQKQLATVTAERDDLKTKLAASNGPKEPMSLKDAAASLDSKNETHWLASGKASLEHLKHLTGNDSLTRAEVDALNIERKQA